MVLPILQIEFPSILLPPDIHSGSIVDVTVSRNFTAEAQTIKAFNALQAQILSTFGDETPATPILRCRNATQTSVVLEWDPISLATADLRHLTLYRNGSKAGHIPRPFENTSTKISGLAVDSEYKFSLVLRTSAGTYNSETLVVRTHKMTDLTGITVTPGIMAPQLRDSLDATLENMGARLSEQVRIDTTHFVCTEGRGAAWEKAVDMNVPVVVPDWVKGCEREGRIVGVRGYYLNADPKLRQVGPGAGLQRMDSQQSSLASPQVRQEEAQPTASLSQHGTPRTEITPPTPERRNPEDAEEDSEDVENEESEEKSDVGQASVEGSERDASLPERPKPSIDVDSAARSSVDDDSGGRSSGQEVTLEDARPTARDTTETTLKPAVEEADTGDIAAEGAFDEVKL